MKRVFAVILRALTVRYLVSLRPHFSSKHHVIETAKQTNFLSKTLETANHGIISAHKIKKKLEKKK